MTTGAEKLLQRRVCEPWCGTEGDMTPGGNWCTKMHPGSRYSCYMRPGGGRPHYHTQSCADAGRCLRPAPAGGPVSRVSAVVEEEMNHTVGGCSEEDMSWSAMSGPGPADAYAITAARKAARSVDADCPNCGAITGNPCRKPDGRLMHRFHLVRTMRARELAQLRVTLRLESERIRPTPAVPGVPTAREVAHDVLRALEGEDGWTCACVYDGHMSPHIPICDRVTAAIEARDRATALWHEADQAQLVREIAAAVQHEHMEGDETEESWEDFILRKFMSGRSLTVPGGAEPGPDTRVCGKGGAEPGPEVGAAYGTDVVRRVHAFLAAGPSESQPTPSLVTTTTGPTCPRCGSLVLGDGRCGNCREVASSATDDVMWLPPESTAQGCDTCRGTKEVACPYDEDDTGGEPCHMKHPCPDCTSSEVSR